MGVNLLDIATNLAWLARVDKKAKEEKGAGRSVHCRVGNGPNNIGNFVDLAVHVSLRAPNGTEVRVAFIDAEQREDVFAWTTVTSSFRVAVELKDKIGEAKARLQYPFRKTDWMK